MQEKYKNLKQKFTKKMKKFVKKVDDVLARLNQFKRRKSVDELQNFQKNLRMKLQIELLKHKLYINRKNFVETVTRLKNVE